MVTCGSRRTWSNSVTSTACQNVLPNRVFWPAMCESPAYLIDSNLNGALNCLEHLRRTGGEMIFLSSSRVYSIPATLDLPLAQMVKGLISPPTLRAKDGRARVSRKTSAHRDPGRFTVRQNSQPRRSSRNTGAHTDFAQRSIAAAF